MAPEPYGGDARTDQQHAQRFEREGRITASISHPGVIEVIDHGARCGIPWIAYEYLPGKTLRDVLAGRPMEIPQVLDAHRGQIA